MPKQKKEKYERSVRILCSVSPEVSLWFTNFGKGKGQLLCKALREYMEIHGCEQPTPQAEIKFFTSPSDCRMTFRLYYPQDADLIRWILGIDGDDWNYFITFVVLEYYRNHYASLAPETNDDEQKSLTISTSGSSYDDVSESDADPNIDNIPVSVLEKSGDIRGDAKYILEETSKCQSARQSLSPDEERTLLRIIYYT